MSTFIKWLWIISVVVVSLSMIWFFLGSTTCFQRWGLDLVESVVYVTLWLPALVYVIKSILLLKEGWIPNSQTSQIFLIIGIIGTTIFFSGMLISQTNYYGWIEENIEMSDTKVTSEGKYEYRLDIKNQFQLNAHARLYIKSIVTGEEIYIRLNVPAKDVGVTSLSSSGKNNWCELIKTQEDNIYILSITSSNVYFQDSFEINMETKKSKKVE